MVNHVETDPERLKRLAWGIARPVCLGVGGNLLVFLFFTTFLHIYTAIKFIPWIVLFNGAVAGFSLVDKLRESIRRKKLISAVIGAAMVLMTCGVLVMLSNFYMGENLLALGDIGLFLLTGVLGSELGTLLGIKYFKLHNG